MKSLVLIFALFLSFSSYAQKAEDAKAIKAMCGCYEVKFNFAETFQYPKDTANYKPSGVKHETAFEWVYLLEDEPKKISLQHLLILGEEMIIKHWRQDWLYENTSAYEYNGFNDWKFKALSDESVKGQWTQKVFEVDDKLRYEGSATWLHVDGRTFWESTTNAPLPRREYTQRDDYNITKRRNVHEIVKDGWVHSQDNDKIIRDKKGRDYVLAQEKGYNTYTKIDDSKCEYAQKWWEQNKDFWKKVRAKWAVELAKNKDIKLKSDIDEKPLHIHLNALMADGNQADIDKIIDNFIISK